MRTLITNNNIIMIFRRVINNNLDTIFPLRCVHTTAQTHENMIISTHNVRRMNMQQRDDTKQKKNDIC